MDKQDRIESGGYMFAQPTTFSDAFPTIKELSVKVEVRKGGPMDGAPRVLHFSIQNPPGEYVSCTNSRCTEGGWCIGDVLREMVAKSETSKTTGGICTGRERMNRASFRECLTHFMAEITVSYT